VSRSDRSTTGEGALCIHCIRGRLNSIRGLDALENKFLTLSALDDVATILPSYKACPSESGTEVGASLFPAVELCDFPGRWQCNSGEIWYTLDSGSVLLTEAEAR